MTAERSAYLRDVAEDALSWVMDTENVRYRIEEAGIPDPDGVRVLARAVPELLDELEACDLLVVELNLREKRITELLAERDSLAAQVVRLVRALRGMRDWQQHNFPHASGAHIIAADKVLADTEAAATTWLESHDREQQLKGAREVIERVRARAILDAYTGDSAGVTFTSMTDALGAMMERDA